jgi:hypothetical protein
VSDDHLSIDELAELDEGLLTPEREIEARAHLAGCEHCRANEAAIATTRAALSNLPAEPMPDHAKARLDKALADASPLSTNVVPSLDAHRAKRFGRPTMAASAAAAAIVLLVGAIVVAHALGGSNNGASSAEEAGPASGIAPSATVAPLQPKNYLRTSTGLNYTPANLLTNIPGLVAKAPGGDFHGPATPGPSASVSTNGTQRVLINQPVPASLKPLYDSRTKLLSCARYVSGIPNAVPIAVDFGRWTNGQYTAAPSVIFVFRDPEPDRVDVIVTDPTCSGVGAVRILLKVPVN